MSAGNENKVKSSMKRLYSRATMLTSAVVFGGIAIAQAQKDAIDHNLPQTAISAAAIAEARPIPVQSQQTKSEEHDLTDPTDVIAVNAEFPDRAYVSSSVR